MTAWDLTDGLKNLRRQVDARWPDRDRSSDGTIGDTIHQHSTSGPGYRRGLVESLRDAGRSRR